MALLVSYFIAFKRLTDIPSTPSLFFVFRSLIILIVVSSLMGNSDNVFRQGLVRKFLYVTLYRASVIGLVDGGEVGGRGRSLPSLYGDSAKPTLCATRSD